MQVVFNPTVQIGLQFVCSNTTDEQAVQFIAAFAARIAQLVDLNVSDVIDLSDRMGSGMYTEVINLALLTVTVENLPALLALAKQAQQDLTQQ